MTCTIPCELIENSQDREEVVETKDWIDDVYDEYQRAVPAECINSDEWYRMKMRKAIEKHAPKQKKFTKEEVGKYAKEFVFHKQVTEFIICFLRDN
jgi:hypothetical protein